MNLLKIVLVLSGFALLSTACGETVKNAPNAANNMVLVTNSNVNTVTPPKTPVDELAAAREIYTISCSNCHKENGAGGKVQIDGKTVNTDNLTTDKMKNMSDAKFTSYIENGILDEGMPAFKGKLTDQQIKDVVSYVRTELQKK